MSPKCSYIKNLRKRGRTTSVFVRDVHPIFVVIQRSIFDKDIDERCKIFLDSMETRITNLESEQFSTKIPSKFLNTLLNKTIQQLSTESPKTMRKLCLFTKFPCKEISRKSINTESSHTIKVNNKENSNTNQKKDKPVLMNQLKD